MKIRSTEKNVYFEMWKTPVSGVRTLMLDAVIQTVSYTHFFFSIGDGVKNFKKKKWDFHVMTFGRGWPYRVMDEEYAYKCLGKYLVSAKNPEKKISPGPNPYGTWKLWGTSFINELDEGWALSGYKKPRDKNVFEYVIITQDEWIEFVSGPQRWRKLRNMTLKSAVRHFLKEF